MLINLLALIAGENRRVRADEAMWIIGYVLGRAVPIIIGWYLAEPASRLILHLMGN